ncbi:MAG: hypothetical protein P1T08_10040 [Acidimicrobiia bacterium]|nr:hypothetical protein [Acidimicrobiia bacterium]
MSLDLPQVIEDRIASISEAELELRGWTRKGMRRRFLDRMERDLVSPQLGDEAPDFELELLTATGKRTGDLMGLSSLRGKPVGLIFGSYT